MQQNIVKGIVVLLATLGVSCAGSKKAHIETPPVGKVEFICIPMMGDKPFYFDSSYVSAAGERFSISNLKFFISDIAFSRSNTPERSAYSDTAKHGVFLIDLSEAKLNAETGFLNHTTPFTMQTGDYSDIRFNIGVPRALNHSDPTQAPYPLNVGNTDMFWEWNSGYIFFLAEGKSPVAEDSVVHLAIGGDKQIMPIIFGDIFNAVPLIQVKENAVTRVNIRLDVNALFKNFDSSNYSFKTEEASVVHGGKYADLLRLNILNSLEFVSTELKINK